MITSIAKCFQENGLLSEARDPAMYERAKTELPNEIDEVAVPEGNELEEDLGITMDEVEEVEGGRYRRSEYSTRVLYRSKSS
mmetsp:Transcript_25372/g.36420  ORF Transcript_25372/g.36420 Transcript_25372/m.36420 type:complete len:82 (+) Transcript_25372:364-609(+)